MKGKQPSITKTEKKSQYPGSEEAMQQISELAPSLVGKLGEAYGGELVAPQDPLQTQAYQTFQKYLNQGGAGQYMNNPLYQQGKGLMSDVLSGQYLTKDTPMMQYAQQKMYGEQVPEAQAALRRALALRGNFYSSAGAQGEGDILENANDFMGNLYAQNYQNELNRQMGMIPAGMQLAQSEANVPLTDIDMMNQMGAYQQQQQQAQDTAAQQEWLRQRQEQMMPLQMAPQMAQTFKQYDYTMNPGKASPFESFISPALQVGALAAAPFTGGASLMAMPALSGLGSAFSTGANPGGFANFMNTVSPYASAAMGMVPGATGGWGNSIWGKSMAGVPQNANYYGGTGYGWTSPYGG